MAMARNARHSGQPAPAGTPLGNDLLAALLASQYRHLAPKLEHVTLKRGEVIYRADQDIDEVYFPENAVVVMVDTTEDQRTVEVGIIGREGIVGINIFLGGAITPDKAIVQMTGGAFRMKAKDLRKEVRFGSPLQRLLLEYTRTFIAVISQSVACSQHHSTEQRLARWLLTMDDYSDSRELAMDHKSIAGMLGVRRVGITEAAGALQAANLIRYRRGRISILDRRILGERSCECYRYIKRQYQGLHGALRPLLPPGARSGR
jgi:CRP-like cAMP-binding protein